MLKVVIDIEANGLENPSEIWVVVAKELDTDNYTIFRKVTQDESEAKRFREFAGTVDCWIGHNICGFDLPVLSDLLGLDFNYERCLDTLILSKLIDYPRKKHSLESYGEDFGLPKIDFHDWSKYSPEMEEYCIRDVDIAERIIRKYRRYIDNPKHDKAIKTEHKFQRIVNDLHRNGFAFDTGGAKALLEICQQTLEQLDGKIHKAFPPRLSMVREINPVLTQHGTLHKKDFKWVKDGDLSEFNGGPFCRCVWKEFNPASHKQVIGILHQAGWKPILKTETHKDAERDFRKDKTEELRVKLEHLKKYGYKICEENLATLPDTAPSSARTLAQRILVESRRRTLTEWINLVREDGRIHGEYYGIGAWTHRMSHSNPNTANIPSEYKEDGSKKYLGREMRELWTAPANRLLVGVDAEGIQLRIFAHYINDPEFTYALVKGRKEDKTDPHSLNQRIVGTDIARTRQAAKRFIYSLLLGGGLPKFAEILSCSNTQAEEALSRILERYTGFADLKKTLIPRDARRGWFEGLDGRSVRIPGDSIGDRRHLCMSGYLQNGEAVVMKMAANIQRDLFAGNPLLKEWLDVIFMVNFVHDEWQTETPDVLDIAIEVAKLKAESIRLVGEELKLNCPLAGSYWNDDEKRYTIGPNWYQTH